MPSRPRLSVKVPGTRPLVRHQAAPGQPLCLPHRDPRSISYFPFCFLFLKMNGVQSTVCCCSILEIYMNQRTSKHQRTTTRQTYFAFQQFSPGFYGYNLGANTLLLITATNNNNKCIQKQEYDFLLQTRAARPIGTKIYIQHQHTHYFRPHDHNGYHSNSYDI